MDIENKLDDDFIFYLEFANSYLNNFEDKFEADHCRIWLYKLCGKQYTDIESKRNRNVYLSNLVLCMQDSKLTDPFMRSPNDVDISNAMQVFGHLPPIVTEPDWLQELAEAPDDEGDENRDGRTYLATRTLPHGEGAFAYIAVTLAEEEPRWLGGGEGVFEEAMQQKFKEHVPPVSEMEQILLRRKNPAERERVLAFYDSLLQNINKELEEEIKPEDNQTVTGLLIQLADDLKRRNEYHAFELMSEQKKRIELLLMLHDRIFNRRQKISKREEVLDDIEHRTLPPSFFTASLEERDKVELPAHMWEQAINKTPNKKNLELLFDNYPNILIEKFLDLLCNEKEDIALRLQRRHENIASQMRKELRQEGEKGKAKSVEVDETLKQAKPILKAIKDAYENQIKHLQEAKSEKKKIVSTDQTELYEQLRGALYDTQKSVEVEAEKGRLLAEQINSVNAQTELYQQANEESIRKTEEANIAIMRNIKRLRGAVKQYENRVQQMQQMTTTSRQGGAQDYFFM